MIEVGYSRDKVAGTLISNVRRSYLWCLDSEPRYPPYDIEITSMCSIPQLGHKASYDPLRRNVCVA